MNLTIDELIHFVEAVEQYYNNAWNKLVLFGTILVALGAIVVPLLIQWWQRQKLQLESDKILNNIRKYVNETVNRTEGHFEKRISDVLLCSRDISNIYTKGTKVALNTELIGICRVLSDKLGVDLQELTTKLNIKLGEEMDELSTKKTDDQ